MREIGVLGGLSDLQTVGLGDMNLVEAELDNEVLVEEIARERRWICMLFEGLMEEIG